MTGNIVTNESSPHLLLKLRNGAKVPSTPRFSRLRLLTEDGTEVWFTDPRRFGRIRLTADPLREPPISKLGTDPLSDFLPAKNLALLLAKRRVSIKSVLLDQTVFAGVGNWIADEALFQARLSPHRRASELTAIEVKRLRTRLLAIIIRAVSVGADHERFPKGWLFHVRWGKRKNSTTTEGHPIRHETIGGRTTAWVPALQR